MPRKPRFSSADRDLIRKHAIGKPTGVIAEVGGFTFDLTPLTTEQAGEVFSIVGTFSGLYEKQNDDGNVEAKAAAIGQLIGVEGNRVRKILRSVLWESVRASEPDFEEPLFDEFFNAQPLKDTVVAVLPKIIEASGLGTLLGNLSTPANGPTTQTPGTATSSPSTTKP